MNFFNNMFIFVENPAKAINKILAERSLALAMLGYAAGALSITLMMALESGPMGGTILLSLTCCFLFLDISIGFFFASSSHLFLELTTGKGNAAGLFTLIGLSEFTKTILVAYALIAAAVPAIAGFRVLVVMLILILQLYFILYMMQRVYGLSKLRTFFALVLSFVPSVISLFSLLFIVAGLLSWLVFK